MKMFLVVILLVLAAAASISAQWISSFSPLKYPKQPSGGEDLGNRFGATEGPIVDRFGFEIQQVNDVGTYPENKKPFWYLNRQAIAQHIGRNPSVTPARSRTYPENKQPSEFVNRQAIAQYNGGNPSVSPDAPSTTTVGDPFSDTTFKGTAQ